MPFISKRSKLRIDSNILEQIIQISVSRTEAQSRVERAKIILAFYSGETVSAIAKSLNTNRPKVDRCLDKAFEIGALNALVDLPRSGKKPKITDDAQSWLIALACQKPTEFGYSYELWTTKLLAEHVRSNCVEAGYTCFTKLGRGTVSKILNKNDIKPHKIKYYLEKKDPDFDVKMSQVLMFYKTVEMYREGKQKENDNLFFISYDEKPGIQAIEKIAPDLPPQKGKYNSIARDYEYKRHGTLSLLAGIDLLTGKIIGQVTGRHRSREFVEYLRKVDTEYPKNNKIKLILDNHSAHISKETRAYLKTVPNRFDFIFTPKHGSWLNLIECFFSKMARTFLRQIRVASKDELKERIELYLEEVNKDPVVFKWKYKMDEVEV
tara:strand:+ start:104 stop:1240 length:1137 start_codon:yes stop_codon:yes gene_type:complete